MEIKDKATALAFCEEWSSASGDRQITHLSIAIEGQEKIAKLHRIYGRMTDEFDTLEAIGVLRHRRLELRLAREPGLHPVRHTPHHT